MQPLLDGPRASLTEAAVRGLLQSHSSIQVSYGATALDDTFGEIGDISRYVSGGEIKCDVTNTVQRTCTIDIDGDVTDSGWSYLSGFVRPHMTFTDMASGVSAKFHLGVYTLTTPSRPLGVTPATLQFSGYDLMYLLRQEVGDSYEVAAGSDPAQAAADVVSLAIPEVTVVTTPSGSTLPTQMTWPFDASNPVTFLQIIQDLLATIGYREVWADWDGKIHIEPFVDFQTEHFEWTFDSLAEDSIVAPDRSQDIDIFNVPNWFRFVMANLTDTPVEGVTQFTWEDTSPSNPGSSPNRGRLIRYIESPTVASYDDLVGYAQRKIVSLLKPSETFTVKTQPFPLAWHLDIIQFFDPTLDTALPLTSQGERRVVSVGWTLPLDGGDMTWTWQTVTDQSAALGVTQTTG